MYDLSEIKETCLSLYKSIEQHTKLGVDPAKTSFTIATDDYRILYVPRGQEVTARMELNESL